MLQTELANVPFAVGSRRRQSVAGTFQTVMISLLFPVTFAVSVAIADTVPIFSVNSVAQYADWIAVGRIISMRDSKCEYPGFGKTVTVGMQIESTWKGKLGETVDFDIFPGKMVTTLRPGDRRCRIPTPCRPMSKRDLYEWDPASRWR